MSDRPSYRGALRSPDFRLLAGALTESSMGDWAYNVALVVYLYEHTHSAVWVSLATLGRMVPTFLASPYAGVLAERFERVRVMVVADVARSALMAAMTVAAATDAPAWVLVVLAGSIAVVQTVYKPATAAMLPQVLGEEHLAAGNALTETINNIAIIAGPAAGALLLAVGSPAAVMGIDAATFLVSALMVARMTARSRPTNVAQDGNAWQQMAVGFRTIGRSATAALLVAFPVATTFLYGVDTVLFVYVSKDKLGTGAQGYGFLLVALGVGGVIAAMFVNRVAALSRLSVVLAAGLICYAAPSLLLIWVHAPAAAFVIESVRGLATLIVDVLAMTALQRSLAPELISRVFGVFWALIVAGLSFGAVVTPLLLNSVGIDTTLALDALVVPGLVILALPRLMLLDRAAAVQAQQLAPRVRLLETLEIFAAAPRPVLERLAGGAEELVVDAGTAIIREGDPADALYVLAEGTLDVSARGELKRRQHIRTLASPTYVGEIGLLGGGTRTATVTTASMCRLLRIDGETFLASLTESVLSPSFVSGMATRLHRTHPSRQVTLPTQRSEDGADEGRPTEVARSS